MRQITTRGEYKTFLRTVADNRNQRGFANAHNVAEAVILDTSMVKDELTRTPVGDIYCDETITPSSVLIHSAREVPTLVVDDSVRNAAVEVLTADLQEHPHWMRVPPKDDDSSAKASTSGDEPDVPSNIHDFQGRTFQISEELLATLDRKYKELDAEWYEKHGEDLPKTRVFYWAVFGNIDWDGVREDLDLDRSDTDDQEGGDEE